jgi:hypothetical protein
MTVRATSWAFGLQPKTAAAKLCAIWLSNNERGEGTGLVELERLAKWCCLSLAATSNALHELKEEHGVQLVQEINGKSVRFQLPPEAYE